MTEEIIIDGVNVAECEHFDRDSSLNNCLAHCIPYPECTCYESCDEHPNCYYKQLKRLEQENEVLTRENENRNNWIMSLRKQCGKLVEEKLIYRSALEEIKSAIVEYLPKKQGDYNFSKSLNPVQYALLEYIQIQIKNKC